MSRAGSGADRAEGAATRADEGAWGRRFGLALLGVFALAAGVRALHLLQIRSAPLYGLYLGDSRIFHEWAERIAGGEWLGEQVFYQAPLYPYLLGGLYALGGRSATAVLHLQALLGAASCALLAVAGRRFFGAREGLLAGAGLALYPTAVYFDGIVQKTTLGLFLLCACLALAGRLRREPAVGAAAGLGAGTGLLALVRENALALVVAWLPWLFALRSGASRWRRLAPVLAFALALGAVLLPVGLRNLAVSGELHLTTSNLGHNLYIGNNPDADGLYMELRAARGNPLHEREDATALAERALGRELTPGEVSRYWAGRAMSFAVERPLEWAELLLRKALLVVNAAEPGDSQDPATYARWSWWLRGVGPLLHFGVLAPLAAFGVAVTGRRRRELAILYALPLLYAAGLLLFFVFARFRIPLVPFALLFAAAGVVGAARFWRESSARGRALALGLALAVAVPANWPLELRAGGATLAEYNIGSALLAGGRTEEALAHLRRAVELEPESAPARYNLGLALLRRGEVGPAVQQLRAARALGPGIRTIAEGVRAAGRSLERMAEERSRAGRRGEALALQRAALALAEVSGRPESAERAREGLSRIRRGPERPGAPGGAP